MKCPVCENETESLSNIVEREVIQMIKRDHPNWVESDGSCQKCVEYYDALDDIVEVID